ncbi:MAG: hypothetical protein ACK5XZ_10600 [Hyphomonadaceae bacterium]|jgi:hypothetical protein|uniref:hypothetical protein n=1 Tax=Aquidulcibacter sp. TaxID=2052990 RepID=UPI0022C65918|nr:hypothetical protein [Aquidulcibacter sp.]MCE2889560.1 hypothetical protein [Hyphomonadaceae bacterium]MCZ8208314.1 hypothetical protein [Aquidulcibacter sp.]
MRFAPLAIILTLAAGPVDWANAQAQDPAPIAAAQDPVPEVTVNLGRKAPAAPMIAPLETKQFELPQEFNPNAASAATADTTLPALSSPAMAMPPAAPRGPLTPAEIAREIAPNFDVSRDYTRLVQCYGTADFMGAITRIQASRPGAPKQVVGVAREIMALSDAMQPMVLAASTVRGEPRFRADYDAFARQGQRELAGAKNPNAVMQRRLATLEACRRDVTRWRKEG